ncbi:MAG: VCBS repeat-containing protein [Bacteroidota bacterium]
MKTHSRFFVVLLTAFAFCSSCKKQDHTLFRLLQQVETGVGFNNLIVDTDSFNILTYEYIYNGGGVGVGDFNNDGLSDLFFTGNQVSNRLYLNQGNFKFQDVTHVASVNVQGRWNSGLAVVDINNDGWQDIYVCATAQIDPELRRNMLFVNQGLNQDGIPTFKEMAAHFNLDFNGHSIMPAFFDYDKDGDLDLYILVNVKLNNVPTNFRAKITDGSSANNDRLFRNEGNGTFTDVSMEAGIRYEGFGLGLAIQDLNNDTWPDIYVSNDYLSNDIIYINKQDGTFENQTESLLGHQSQFSMGNDVGDINNDALPDIITLDMLPENSERKKTTIGNKSYQTYVNNEDFSYQYQYVRNMLHLNNGAATGIKFSEIGQLAGVHQTEWSWSPLFADFDNDGWRDLAITNGFPKDITDKDFANYRSELMNLASPGYLVDSIPVVKIPNYGFKNNGDLTFTDASAVWGLNQPSFSNGAAFADLDNDGDLDYVVNNINAPAFVYENTLRDSKKTELSAPAYLRIRLQGPAQNRDGFGTKLTIYLPDRTKQFHEHYTQRGYLSSVEPIVHFGLGANQVADSLHVVWPDGKQQKFNRVNANQLLTVSYADAKDLPFYASTSSVKMVSPFEKESQLSFLHVQKDLIDFNVQRTIPHKFSQFGPALTVGDINGDEREDILVGGSPGAPSYYFIQRANGTFAQSELMPAAALVEDTGLLLFDCDGDGDLDLYTARGGFELQADHESYRHTLYVNDGKGRLSPADKLPAITTSAAVVRASDVDSDGDLDLFVGGRVVPGQYPLPPASYLLKNENGTFVDATETWCAPLRNLGMITDALWSDVDNDGKMDLVVTGELMAISVFRNSGNGLQPLATGLESSKGWWNSLAAGDFDGDGDTDFLAGNLGKNNPYQVDALKPVVVFAKDLDKNGSIEALTFCYSKMLDGSEQLCPLHFWDELNQQSPRFRRQFSRYKHFAKATFETLLSKEDKEGALMLEANMPNSSYVENLGGGKFRLTSLPMHAQVAPVNGILSDDVNGDGHPDGILIGNNFGNEVFIGRMDAFTGLILLGDGKGNFSVVPSAKSGFYVPNDAKALVRLTDPVKDLLIASQNRDSLRVFATRPASKKIFSPETLDTYAFLYFADGRKQKVEFYYGSGYLSQSSRRLRIPVGVRELEVFNSRGQSRKIAVETL